MTAETQGEQRAEAFRVEHSLGQGPLGDLVALIELTQNVDVAVLDAGSDEHGMTMRDPVRDVLMVAVARTRNPMRQRSTLAHELGHVLFGDDAPVRTSGWAERSPEEIRADAFARHFLAPLPGLRAVLGSRSTVDVADLSLLTQRFLVSPAIIAIQLKRAGYIDSARKQEWISHTAPSLAVRFGWSDQYHALQRESDNRRAPQRLLARAIDGYITNTVSLETIARLRGTSATEVQRDLVAASIVPQPQAIAWATPGDLPGGNDDFTDLDALDTEIT